ncbi:MAG: sulfatase-like hydrolase/transferase [Candidatus Hodarchaeota archaeon]
MTNKPNIVWIIVDSVRNYIGKDKYSKLEIMQEFAKEGVEFTNTVTSAPSTLMSASAMLSSRPAYYLSRDFGTFKYDKTTFFSLTDILKSNYYHNYTIHHYPQMRDRMGDVLYSVPQKYWPKRINKYKLWNEEEINSIFFRLVKRNFKEPFFLFIHYDVPANNRIASKKIGQVLKKLKEKNLYDNSIIILCSDHGYSDPDREKLSLRQLVFEGHDSLTTDDNIMMPLIIKYPGCPKGKKITEVVSSLDITPTILSILGIPHKKYGFEGLNLLNYIGGKKILNRKIRTDTRYCFQPKRLTSLRSNNHKYVYSHFGPIEQREKFFDLKKDGWEKNNLINNKHKKILNKINEFRKELELTEKKGIELQKEYLGKKIKRLLKQIKIKRNKILIFGAANPLFVDIILKNFSKQDIKMDLLIKKKTARQLKTKSEKVNQIYTKLTYRDFKKRLKDIRKKHYDLVFIPLVNHLCVGYNPIFKIARKLNSDKIIAVDYNLVLIKEHNMWLAVFNDLKKVLWSKLLRPLNFGGNLVALVKRILFEKPF